MNEQQVTVTFEQENEKAVVTIKSNMDGGAKVSTVFEPSLKGEAQAKLMHNLAFAFLRMLGGGKK